MRLKSDIDLSELPARLRAALPDGIRILDVQAVDEAEPALQMQVTSAEYEVTFDVPLDAAALRAGIERILAATSLPRERRDKAYDLRPLIEEMEWRETAGPAEQPVLFMRLSARESATGRPEEVLAELGIPRSSARIERSCLLFQH